LANDNWETPQYIFDWIQSQLPFRLVLDVAASDTNHKCPFYYTKEQDGLSQDWGQKLKDLSIIYGDRIGVWCNPPYSDPAPWVAKIVNEKYYGAFLLPADTSTSWYHDYVLGKAEIRFVKGRISFDGAKKGTPKFGSMIAVYGLTIAPKVIGVKRPDDPRKQRQRAVS
jgi:phage N-6-adenine-methyltransferase